MNDLLTSSFSKYRSSEAADIEIGTSEARDDNLNKFFEDVATVKEDLKEVDELLRKLKEAHEESTTLHNAKAVKDLRAKMDRDISLSLKKAKLIKVRLEALDKASEANRKVQGCGQGSPADRTRTTVVNGLMKNLKEKMGDFQELRERINAEYRETVERRYFTVTGENPDEKTVDLLISTGESETFLQKAIQEQGRGRVLDTLSEIQERHDAVQDLERSLRELHQVFMDMAVMVQHQGGQLDNIQAQVEIADTYISSGTKQLQGARNLQKNTRKWTCYAIILLLVVILIVILSLKPWTWK